MTPDWRKHLIDPGAIAFLWLAVNGVLYSMNSIKVVTDSKRYLEYATGLVSGFYFDSHNFWYIGYALFIALIFKFGGGIVGIVIGQYILGLAAVLALYRAAFMLWSSRISAFITCILFLLFIDISSWNSYVLTESIYVSFICFSMYGLVFIYKGERRWFVLLLISLIVLFTSMIKPTGIAMLGAVCVVGISIILKRISSLAIRVVFVLMITVLFGLLVNRMLTTYLVIENYHSGEIIYAVTTIPDQSRVEGLILETPDDLYYPPASDPPAIRIAAFILHHPLYWTNLFLHKVYYLLSHTRPFWSAKHNIFSAVFLLVAYASFFMGIRDKLIGREVVIFAVTFLLVHVLSVGITSDDWDGRFLIPMLPVIFIFSGHGLANWRYRKSTQ